jgi:hypothetical protein
MTCRLRAILMLGGIAGGAALAWSKVPLELPGTCLFRRITGLPCASCGLTHAACALAHGEFWAAERYNLAAVPLAVLGAVLLVGLVMEVWTNRPWLTPAWRRSRRVLTVGIVALMATAWVFHFVPGPF